MKYQKAKFIVLLFCIGMLVGLPISQISAQGVSSQKHQITGVVKDANGEAVIGASVVEKGTTNGIMTDMDGNFTLSVKSGSFIVISSVGYKKLQLSTDSKSNFNVMLEEDSKTLNEVVVVGYGTEKMKNITGSITTVKVSDSPLSIVPSTDAMSILKGTIPGINISQEQGAGQSPSLLIRGQRSVNGNTSPLIVLDGVIFMGDMRDIDPNTIDKVTVLKDATSVAAYGSRAANGVIMITTKTGQQGKPVINFKSSYGFSKVINQAKVLSPSNWIKKVNLLEGLAEDADPSSWMSDFELENYKAGRTVNWQDVSERTGSILNNSLSISGAGEKMNYYLSTSYDKTEGVLIGDDYNRKSFNSNLTTHITDWLEVGANTEFSYNDYSGPTNYDIYEAIRLTPYGRVYRDNDKAKGIEKFPATEGIYRINPLWNVKSGTIDDHDVYYNYILNGHALVKCPWIEGLSYRLNYSYTANFIERDYFTHEGNYVAEGTSDNRYSNTILSGYLAESNGYSARTKDIAWVWDNIINYDHNFGKHHVAATFVYTRDSYKYYYKKMTGSDFSQLGNTELGYNGLSYAATQKIASINNTVRNNIGYLGRINYDYNDTYHLTASIRRDGSSVFGANKKWGYFPAVGVAWTASNEKFMKSISLINYLKLKFSIGTNGNQSLNPYSTLSTISLGQNGGYGYPFGNTSTVSWGQRVTSLGNPDLGWEKTLAFDGGFDLTILQNRISLNMDAYKSKTTNQIFSKTIPVMASGITTINATMGQVNNWGVEFTLTTQNIKNKDFEWTSSLIYYLNRNKLVNLYGDGKSDITNSLFLNRSLGAIYGYKPVGIVQSSGDEKYISANGAVAGDVKFWDRDGNGTITSNDRCILGYSKENFRMSLNNTIRYKNFELYTLFTGVFGGGGYYKAVNIYAYRTASDVVYDNNFDHGWWTSENASKKYPRINYTDGRYTPVQSMAFVRLQNLSISYDVKSNWIRKMNIQNLRLYAAGTNLFTITGWTGGDPETGQTLGSGYSYGYPLSATYSFGVSLTF